MKKILMVLTSLLITVFVFAGCTNGASNENESKIGNVSEVNTETETETAAASEPASEDTQVVRVASLKGPTTIGMVKMMDDNDGKYEFNIYASASEISPLLISGDVDIANIPANLAAVLYAKTNGEITVLDINTLGVLYMIGASQDIASFEDVKGKTIYTTGKGTTPEYTLNYLITANGFKPEDFNIEYKSESVEVVAALEADKEAVGVLPQPFVTVAQTQLEHVGIIMSFTEEWRKVSDDSELITGVTVVRKEFLENNTELVEGFMNDLEASINYVNSNVYEMSKSVEKYDIIKAPVAVKAIQYCNLSYVAGEDMKSKISGYLRVLYEQDKESVGGNLPEDDFYYQAD